MVKMFIVVWWLTFSSAVPTQDVYTGENKGMAPVTKQYKLLTHTCKTKEEADLFVAGAPKDIKPHMHVFEVDSGK